MSSACPWMLASVRQHCKLFMLQNALTVRRATVSVGGNPNICKPKNLDHYHKCFVREIRRHSHCKRKLSYSIFGSDGLNVSKISHNTNFDALEVYKQPSQELKTSATLSAGHSKWANIKHIKGAKDEIKSAIRLSVTKRIQATIRETGVSDPKYNNTLARLIAEARTQNVPNSTIENVIKAAVVAREKTVTLTFNGMGPGNCVVVVEIASHHSQATKNEVLGLFKKNGIRMIDSSLSRLSFDHKGFVDVGIDTEGEVDLDKYVDMAIEAGAENVNLQKFDDGELFLRFECDPSEIYIVKSKLAKHGLDTRDCVSEYVARTMVELSDKEVAHMKKLCDKIRANFNVENITINVDMET